MRRGAPFFAATACLIGSAASAQDISRESLVSALRSVAPPNVAWDSNTAISADVTCDGRGDNVLVGYQGGSIWVGLVPGGRASGSRRPIALRFGIELDKPDAFCSTPVRLQSEPLVCSTSAGPLPGCKPVAGCIGFAITDDVCGAVHFHWDNDRNALSWSRR